MKIAQHLGGASVTRRAEGGESTAALAFRTDGPLLVRFGSSPARTGALARSAAVERTCGAGAGRRAMVDAATHCPASEFLVGVRPSHEAASPGGQLVRPVIGSIGR